MLTVNYSDDECLLSELFNRLNIVEKDYSGIIAVLFDNQTAVGFCRMSFIDNTVEILDYRLTDEAEKEKGVSDFFFRTILFKLTKTEAVVKIKTDCDCLKRFGFNQDDEYMYVVADDIVFPSECSHH